ncbi:MAG: sigma-70 family RNA polymerase sigma factor [bacterium]|nr:sigma-70 family RNA polymerase sigma factor [bacterium]
MKSKSGVTAREAAVRSYAAMLRYARWLGVPAGDCEDVVQGVYARFTAVEFDYRSDIELGAYLRRMVRNSVLSRRREVQRDPLIGAVTIEAGAFDRWFLQVESERTERQEALAGCLGRLAEREQHVLRMIYGESSSHAEVATRFGLRAAGVKTLVRRCKTLLRRCVEARMRARRES